MRHQQQTEIQALYIKQFNARCNVICLFICTHFNTHDNMSFDFSVEIITRQIVSKLLYNCIVLI